MHWMRRSSTHEPRSKRTIVSGEPASVLELLKREMKADLRRIGKAHRAEVEGLQVAATKEKLRVAYRQQESMASAAREAFQSIVAPQLLEHPPTPIRRAGERARQLGSSLLSAATEIQLLAGTEQRTHGIGREALPQPPPPLRRRVALAARRMRVATKETGIRRRSIQQNKGSTEVGTLRGSMVFFLREWEPRCIPHRSPPPHRHHRITTRV
jgi:hypothetical protein